jgi:hypothetical protein
MKHLSGTRLKGKLLARSGSKGLPRTNILAYYKLSLITDVKTFIKLGPGANVIKLFTSVIYKCS